MFDSLKHPWRAGVRDSINRWHWGEWAPTYGQTIWVNPRECSHFLPEASFKQHFRGRLRQSSGRVVSHWPSEALKPLHDHEKVQYCMAHWQGGLSWQASGGEAWMLAKIMDCGGAYDGCRNLNDIHRRFEELDLVFERVKATGRLLTRAELDHASFREVGGILMHIDPDGQPVFSGAGCHRLSMALLLGRPFPAQLGVVHQHGLERLKSMQAPTPV
jgi:hypothetical protein